MSDFDLLPACCNPSEFKNNPDRPLEHKIKLMSESERVIPGDNLIFLGNLSGDDFIPFRGHDYWTGYQELGWESSKYNTKFEHYVIDAYLARCDIKP